jgi:AraC-like DNA-binding protein
MQRFSVVVGLEHCHRPIQTLADLQVLLMPMGYGFIQLSESAMCRSQLRVHPESRLQLILHVLGRRNGQDPTPHTPSPSSVLEELAAVHPLAVVLEAGESEIVSRVREAHDRLSLWKTDAAPNLLKKASLYIYERLGSRTLSVTQIAREMGVSEDTLERTFQVWEGVGVWTFVRHVRANEAQRILIETAVPIQDVAELIGLSKTSFSRFFREQTNLTPREFRLLKQRALRFGESP